MKRFLHLALIQVGICLVTWLAAAVMSAERHAST